MKARAIRAVALGCMTLASGASMGQAFSVTNGVWSDYYATTAVTLPFGGPGGTPFNSTEYFSGTIYGWSQGGYVNGAIVPPPPPLTPSANVQGNSAYGLPTVGLQAYAFTTYGTNHAMAQVSNYDPKVFDTTQTLCMIDPSTGACSGAPFDLTYHTQASAYVTARSNWRDIYQLAGSSGTASYTFMVDVGTLGPTTPAAGASSGGSSSYFQWSERDFNGNTIASVSGNYSNDGTSDGWYLNWWDNHGGGGNTSGSGALLAASSDAHVSVTVDRSFVLQDTFYVESELYVSASGDAVSDLSNTVTLTNVSLPAGTRVLASSGNDYGGVFSFSGGSGTVCTSLSCLGGGGPPPVPEPETWAMMLGGLLSLAFLARRRMST